MNTIEIINAFNQLQYETHQNAVLHGFYDGVEFNFGEKIALIHSEVSEALEGHRKGSPKDEHCPDFTSEEVELADVIIRIFDLAEHQKLNVAAALIAKHNYNKTRPYKHNKLF